MNPRNPRAIAKDTHQLIGHLSVFVRDQVFLEEGASVAPKISSHEKTNKRPNGSGQTKDRAVVVERRVDGTSTRAT